MTAPLGADLDLQIAMVTALRASADLISLIGDAKRVYQDVPDKPKFPYVTVGFGTKTDNSNQCMNAVQAFPLVHIWSRAPQSREAKMMEAAAWVALHNVELPLTENRCFSIIFQRSDLVPDPDGVTRHIAMTFNARVEPAA